MCIKQSFDLNSKGLLLIRWFLFKVRDLVLYDLRARSLSLSSLILIGLYLVQGSYPCVCCIGMWMGCLLSAKGLTTIVYQEV